MSKKNFPKNGRLEDKIYFITWYVVVCTRANAPGAQKQTYHVSNRVPPASSSRSKILFAKEKQNMEKMFDGGVLSFQAPAGFD